MSLNTRLLMAFAGIPLAIYAAMAVIFMRYGDVQSHAHWLARLSLGGVLLGFALVVLALALGRRLTRPLDADALQQQIDQATVELQASIAVIEAQNVELETAHRSALHANAVKSEFLANMSHEVRTPLNGIIGFCRLLGRSRLDTRQQEWLQHVHHACDNLLMLVSDVLDFSQLDANRLTLEDTQLDMVSLVDKAIGLHAPDAQRKQLHLLAMVYDDVPTPVRGDPLRLQQVLNNLIGNALKFTHSGGVIVRVMHDEDGDDQRRVLRISVSDTGIGLSHAQQARLFQAFTQAEPSHSREFGGSGLGLSICRQLIQRMGGKIRVDSQPDRGSTFAVTLPLQAPAAGQRPPELTLPKGTAITLYEPHAPTHFSLTHLIERWGGQINAATAPGATAWEPRPPANHRLCLLGMTQADLMGERRAVWQAYIRAAGCPTLVLANATGLEAAPFSFPHGGELLGKPCGRDALAAALKRLLVTHAPPARRCPKPLALTVKPAWRLLVVDDNAANRQLLKALLESERVQVSTAASGREALDTARQADTVFDMVLMDIRLPGMDGVQATQALRRVNSGWARCPIIAVTAHALSHERRRWLVDGFDDVLIKPIDETQLQALLQHFLGDDAAAFDNAPQSPAPANGAGKPLAAVDLALGARLAGGHEAQARRLLSALVESLDQSEHEMAQARRQGDAAALLNVVHHLHGAIRYCGAPELALLVESLETRLRTDGMAYADPLLGELYQAMARLRAAAPRHVDA